MRSCKIKIAKLIDNNNNNNNNNNNPILEKTAIKLI